MSSFSDCSKHDLEAAVPHDPTTAASGASHESPATAPAGTTAVLPLDAQTPPEIATSVPMLCGIKRRTMLITIGAGIFILILAIVFGVAAGIALKT